MAGFFFFFGKLTQTRVAWEEESSVEKMSPSDCLLGMSVWHFLDCYSCGGIQPTVDNATPKEMVLEGIRKAAEEEPGSIESIPPSFLPLFLLSSFPDFPSDRFQTLGLRSQTHPFFAAFGQCFYPSAWSLF